MNELWLSMCDNFNVTKAKLSSLRNDGTPIRSGVKNLIEETNTSIETTKNSLNEAFVSMVPEAFTTSYNRASDYQFSNPAIAMGNYVKQFEQTKNENKIKTDTATTPLPP